MEILLYTWRKDCGGQSISTALQYFMYNGFMNLHFRSSILQNSIFFGPYFLVTSVVDLLLRSARWSTSVAVETQHFIVFSTEQVRASQG